MNLRLPSSVAALSSVLLSCIQGSWAQIVPDQTLGAEQSVVVPDVIQGLPSDRIDGGAVRGSLLFHSFEEFNIGEGQGAYFSHPDAVNAIFSRVTGNNPSNLFGKLGVLGDADLVFLNTNGVLFGPNASLDLTGSFAASTASDVIFPDGQAFGTSAPGAPDVLKVNVEAPVGLVFEGIESGDLTNQADLAVQSGETLMVQGATTLHSGALTAPGGEVRVLGERVGLIEDAQVDVSGDGAQSGGVVLIGGDLRGQSEVPTAARTFVGEEVEIRADGGSEEDGGRVIVWADEVARFYGNVSARGGDESGDGGFVEVSGKETLIFEGVADLSADKGFDGELLLDPRNIVVSNSPSSPAEVIDSLPQVLFEDAFLTNTDTVINISDLLASGGSITLQADESITIEDEFSARKHLTLSAKNIVILDKINVDGRDLKITAGENIIASKSLESNRDSDFDTDADGTVDLEAGGEIEVRSIDGDLIRISAGEDIQVGSIDGDEDGIFITSQAGSITIDGQLSSDSLKRGGRIQVISEDGRITIGSIDASALKNRADNNINSGFVQLIAQEDISIADSIISQGKGGRSENVEVESKTGNISIKNQILTSSVDGGLSGDDSERAGNISLRAVEGDIRVGSATATSKDKDGGSFSAIAGGRIDFAGNIVTSAATSDGESAGNVYLESGLGISINSINARAIKNGGNVSLVSKSDISFSLIESISTKRAGGLINIFSSDGSVIGNNSILTNRNDSTLVDRDGVNIEAENDILVKDISTASSRNGFGDITLISRSGNISVAEIDSSSQRGKGGDILVQAAKTISFNGALNAASGSTIRGDVSIEGGEGDIRLEGITAKQLDVVSEGLIEGAGILQATGDASFTSNLAAAGSVSIRNTEPTTLGNSVVGGNFSIDSELPINLELKNTRLYVAGDISVNGGDSEGLEKSIGIEPGRTTSPDGQTTTITELGTVTLEEEVFPGNLIVNSLPRGVVQFNDVLEKPAITLKQANQFSGTLSFDTAVGPDSIAQELSPGINQTGPISVSGTTQLDADFGNIVLDDPVNTFGDLAFTGNNVFLADGDGFNLLNSKATGSLKIETGGALTQSAPLTVDGPTQLVITQSEAGRVSLTNVEPTVLDDVLIGGDFTLNALGGVSQVPGTLLQVAGNVNGAGAVALADFDTPEDLPINVLPSDTGGDAIITEVGPINISERLNELGISEVSGNLTVNSLARAVQFEEVFDGEAIALTANNQLSGPITITTDASTISSVTGTPDIVQSAPISVAGAANFRAETGTITLDAAANQFGQLSLRGYVATVREQDSTDFLGSEITGDLALVAEGSITQTEDLNVAGNTSLTSLGADTPIILPEDNRFEGTISLNTSADAQLGNINAATILTESNIGGDFKVQASGELTQDAPVTVAGKAMLEAEGINLGLDNDFNVVTVQAGDRLNLNDVNDLNLQDSQLITRDNIPSDITLTAGGKLTLENSQFVIRTDSRTSKDIQINAQQLAIQDGSVALTVAEEEGQAGNLIINAEQIELFGDPTSETPNILGSINFDQGRAGNITINADDLSVRDGSIITAATLGSQPGGNVTVNAEAVRLSGVNTNGPLPSVISTDTVGSGAGGTVSINTNQLLAEAGGTISASTFAEGKGGNIRVNADEVNLAGRSNTSPSTSSGISARSFSRGAGGTIDVVADEITLEDSANITTSSRRTLGSLYEQVEREQLDDVETIFEASDQFIPGFIPTFSQKVDENEVISNPGDAGDINLTARNISMNQRSELFARSRAEGDGGNINLVLSGLLLMRNQSTIETTAGTDLAGGDGGNITIDIEDGFIFGVRQEDSDIAANAFTGNGGNVDIAAQNIFGLKFRPERTPFSDITASSEFGLDGTVTILTPNIDPTRGLNQLQPEPRDSDIDDGCQVNSRQGTAKYFDIGLGGTPPGPEDFFQADNLIATWIDLPSELAEAIKNTNWSYQDKLKLSGLGQYPTQSFSFTSSCLEGQYSSNTQSTH